MIHGTRTGGNKLVATLPVLLIMSCDVSARGCLRARTGAQRHPDGGDPGGHGEVTFEAPKVSNK